MEKSTDPKLPVGLRKVLAYSAQTKSQWKDLTPIGRRDFVSWIESAKQSKTRSDGWLSPDERFRLTSAAI